MRQARIAELKLTQEVRHVNIGGVLLQCIAQQHALRIVIDRGRTLEAGLGEIIVFAQILTLVLVQRLHHPSISGGQIGQQDAAGVEMIGVGVPDPADRGDRLQRRVAGCGGEVAGGTQIRDAGRRQPPVAPILPGRPVDHFGIIGALGGRA